MTEARRIFCYANVGRSGLANMLLPWARCEIFARDSGAAMLAPRWTQPKIGPWLRSERDKRYYFGLFDCSPYIRGWRRWWLLATRKRIPEGSKNNLPRNAGVFVVEFKGLGKYFADLAGHSQFLHDRLYRILSRRSATLLSESGLRDFIAVHIRRGDMPVLKFGSKPPTDSMLWAVPTEWYVQCITQMKKLVGNEIPIIVFTDADPQAVADVLRIPGVQLAAPNPAVVDMLLMARSRVLVTSASSTFSMWSSFLGQMPSIWYPSEWREQTNWENPDFECYTDLEGNLPFSFARLLIERGVLRK